MKTENNTFNLQNKSEIVSQATILVLNRKILLLERKLPYGIADNVFYSKYQREFTQEEKKNIVSYYCGKIFAFEDKFDFPKGRGNSFNHAIKEVEEETGYKIESDIIYKIEKCFADISYVGFDNKCYKIVFHVVFLTQLPVKIRKGEMYSFILRWIPLSEVLDLLCKLNDKRNKFPKYFIILKNILQNCITEKIF